MTCNDYEQDLALAATDCLDASRLSEIRVHCRACSDCAARLEQFQRVSSAHLSAADQLNELSLRYHHIPGLERRPARLPVRYLTNLVWRWLLPLGTVAALAVGLLVKEQKSRPPRPRVDSMTMAVPAQRSVYPAPTLAAYRKAAEQSGEASLDALLARDANRLLRGTSGQKMRGLLDESF